MQTELTGREVSAPVNFKQGLIEYASLCERLGVSRPALDGMSADLLLGFPPRIRLGRKYYVSEAEVVRWVKSRTSTAEAA